jgi:hypothetical protein
MHAAMPSTIVAVRKDLNFMMQVNDWLLMMQYRKFFSYCIGFSERKG